MAQMELPDLTSASGPRLNKGWSGSKTAGLLPTNSLRRFLARVSTRPYCRQMPHWSILHRVCLRQAVILNKKLRRPSNATGIAYRHAILN